METVTTPPQWQHLYGLEHGAAFGMSHGLNQLAAFRPSIRDKQVQGLYFVGASTRPGNGVPLCMISAALAEEHIWTDFQRSH
jgi:phytoene dehydrogenase-like protein